MVSVPLRQSAIVEILRSYFQQEASCFGVSGALLYGSRASGFSRLESDIDVAIVFDDAGLPEDEVFERLTAITLGLMKVLPGEVNLIPIYTDFRKPMLYYNAIIGGIPLFFADQQKYIDLINEALYHMEDFETFGRKWLIDLATRNLGQILHG